MSPEVGAIHGGWKGHLLPPVADVTGVTAEFIRIGPLRVFGYEPMQQQGMIPLWEVMR